MFRAAVPPLIVLASLAGNPAAHAQSFEVATVKPAGPLDASAGRYIRMQSGNRFQAKNCTVRQLIAAAYNLNPRALSGGPAWAEADRYDIVATTSGDRRPAYEEQMAMLARLLTDRFQLTFHREKKNFAIYEITVSKTGPKLRTAQAQPDEASNLTSVVYPAAGGGIDHILMPGRNATMPQFAAVLQRAGLDRPVVDSTGLTGRYDFDLDWTPDETQFEGQLPQANPLSGKPSFFTAFQEQLGLKIEATRGPVETLVIDGVRRPSDN